MEDQHQGQDQLPQASVGNRQGEADLLGLGFGVEGAGQSILGRVGLSKERSYDGTLDFFRVFWSSSANLAEMRPFSISD